MKKAMAMVLALVLMACAMALPVNAADSVVSRVYLDAPVQAEAGETVGVALYVNGNTAAGGVQGTVTYDATKLSYKDVTLRDDVTTLGNTEDVTVRVDGTTGTVKFVTLSNVAGGTAPADAWLTLNFEVKMTTPGDDAAVALSGVKVSDKTGSTKLDPKVIDTGVKLIKIETNDYVDMDGATIRTSVENQGIRFQATPDEATIGADNMAGITEVGVVMMPAELLYEDQDLTMETIGKNGTKPAVAKIDATEAEKLAKVQSGEEVYATLTNGTTNGRANVKIVARAYVVVNGVTIYSHNDITDKDIATGEATKTLVSVAQAIATKEIAGGATDTLGDLLTSTAVLSNDDVTALLTFCRDNIGFLPKEA